MSTSNYDEYEKWVQEVAECRPTGGVFFMSKHTPGPWSVSYGTDISGIENDTEAGCVGQVDVAHVYLRTVDGRTEANARLIAAAPELLEAARLVIAWYESEDDRSTADFYQRMEMCRLSEIALRAAIAKATGEK